MIHLRALFACVMTEQLTASLTTKRLLKVPNGSMLPSLLAGDHVVIDKGGFLHRKPVHGDIIVFKYPEDTSKLFVKRVIGVPGDTVEIRSKAVYVNGIQIDEPYMQL